MPEVPPFPQLDIVAETERFVVVNKPPGLLSVPGIGPEKADCVAERVRHLFPAATGPLTCHRLDLDTSGLIVLGLDAKAHRHLSMQFEARSVEKRYTAVLVGEVRGEAGLVDLPLCHDWAHRPLHRVDFDMGKPSKTEWRVVARPPGRTRVEFKPITGRSHQLRLHAADPRGLGCPIVGDPLYGDATLAPRMLLHASVLGFVDPMTDRPVAFESAPGF